MLKKGGKKRVEKRKWERIKRDLETWKKKNGVEGGDRDKNKK